MLTRRGYAAVAAVTLMALVNLPKGHHNVRSFGTGWACGVGTILFVWALGGLLND